MACYHPLKARRTRGPGGLLFLRDEGELSRAEREGHEVLRLPCGRCIGCRLDRAKSWTMRCVHEASLHEVSSFLTLTYDDQHLRHGDLPTLYPRDLTLFNKRLRKRCRAYRYFACGEYGGTSGRPHYHVLAFGWRPAKRSQVTASTWDSEELDELWSEDGQTIGISSFGEVTPASAAYVAQYSLKKQHGKSERERGRAAEFVRMSKGIGAGWLARYSSDLDRGYVHQVGGRKSRIPRYYMEKKGDDDPEWYLMQRLKAREYRAELDPDLKSPERLHAKETIHLSARSFHGENLRDF